MYKYSVDSVKGKLINEGTINERRIKLFASPVSRAKREAYGCGMALIEPGQVHEEHMHPDSEELIFVVQGVGEGRVGGQPVSIKANDLLAIAKGEAHTFTNTGAEQLRLLWIYSPPGPEKRFLDDDEKQE